MNQLLVLKNKGLFTSPNEFSSVPDGALLRALNCNIDVDNIIEPRRGFDRPFAFVSASDRASRYGSYQDTLIAHYRGSKLARQSGSSWVEYSGSYSHPDSSLARLRFLRANNNLYFTTSSGVYKLDSATGTPTVAGMFKGLDIQVSLTGGTGFLATANQVAYRVVWGIKDAQNNIVKGAPSGRAVISNGTGGSRDVTLVITVPQGATTAHFFQIYRSKASGGAAVEPDDELGLVYENNPTAGQISGKTITLVDSTTDDLRGETIYTAPSQEGIAQANELPPQAQDIEEFQDCVIYANVASKHRLRFTMLAVGGTSGVRIGDTLTIASTPYVASSGENINGLAYAMTTAGTPAQNIANTVDSLIRVINRNNTNTAVYAHLLSGPTDLPGQVLLEERGIGTSGFNVLSSVRGTAFNPVLPTSGNAVASSNDDFQHVLMIAKKGQSEAVPLGNLRRVGSANNPIYRVKKLRNTLFIFKKQEGIFRMTGTDPSNMEVELFDSSARLIAPDSVDVVNNEIWSLCDQGVTVVTETGVSIVSRPIEDLILDTFGTALTQVAQYAWGMGYETDRRYLLGVPEESTDTYPTKVFSFNVFTRAWTNWDKQWGIAFVNPSDDRIYAGEAESNYTAKERKSKSYTDYVDHAVLRTLTSYTGKRILLSSTSGIEVGDLLFQTPTKNSVITAVDANGVNVDNTISWTSGAATSAYKGYQCDVEYTPIAAGNPGALKQWPEIAFLFKQARFVNATAEFATDVSQGYEEVPITGQNQGRWGLFPWAEAPWGGTVNTIPKRTYVPLEKQRSSFLRVRFKLREGYGFFKLLGLSVPFRMTPSTYVSKE